VDDLPLPVDEFELDRARPTYEPYEAGDDSTSPVAAEFDYGWPIEHPESAREGVLGGVARD
jgi:hypothetical protein